MAYIIPVTTGKSTNNFVRKITKSDMHSKVIMKLLKNVLVLLNLNKCYAKSKFFKIFLKKVLARNLDFSIMHPTQRRTVVNEK
ncbi:hypothetical protein D1097_00315 [Actinobacillus pleuropneumoniae serovar 4 str. M62]|nr:hypothetical protein D1101_00310 [Actinobacillus pleuropneumoniae serovar 8 str. 405]UKH40297.1 hypothetical protein D1097_00315 [Actinobacillus pleuropneumoniae serovar 4 str. M62]